MSPLGFRYSDFIGNPERVKRLLPTESDGPRKGGTPGKDRAGEPGETFPTDQRGPAFLPLADGARTGQRRGGQTWQGSRLGASESAGGPGPID